MPLTHQAQYNWVPFRVKSQNSQKFLLPSSVQPNFSLALARLGWDLFYFHLIQPPSHPATPTHPPPPTRESIIQTQIDPDLKAKLLVSVVRP